MINRVCEKCEVSLVCVTEEMHCIFKCRLCGRIEAEVGRKDRTVDGNNFYYRYVSLHCPDVDTSVDILTCEECIDAQTT